MPGITIGRYDHESITKDWAGWFEPADKSWIIYTDADGKADVHTNPVPRRGGQADRIAEARKAQGVPKVTSFG